MFLNLTPKSFHKTKKNGGFMNKNLILDNNKIASQTNKKIDALTLQHRYATGQEGGLVKGGLMGFSKDWQG